MTKKKILITGGTGFIGYHLTKHLLRVYQRCEIVLVDNLMRGKLDNDMTMLLHDSRVSLQQLDLTDPAIYVKFGNGYDHVYHLAAINGTDLFYKIPQEVLRVNLLSHIYMLEWFRKENVTGKFLFTSSNEAYAGGLNAFGILPIPTPEKVPLVIDDPYNPRWSYASTKLAGELLTINYSHIYNFRALIIRPHNFYGPRAGYNHVILEFSLRIVDHIDPFPIYGANETRTFCYIDDAVRAMQMLMDSEKTDGQPIETVHIGDREEITMRNLAKQMFSVTGWKPKKIEIKNSPKGSVKRRLADISKLTELVGWKPKISLDEGLGLAYEWYLKHPKKSS